MAILALTTGRHPVKWQPVFGPDQWPTIVAEYHHALQGSVQRFGLCTVGHALALWLNAFMLTIGRLYPLSIRQNAVCV